MYYRVITLSFPVPPSILLWKATLRWVREGRGGGGSNFYSIDGRVMSENLWSGAVTLHIWGRSRRGRGRKITLNGSSIMLFFCSILPLLQHFWRHTITFIAQEHLHLFHPFKIPFDWLRLFKIKRFCSRSTLVGWVLPHFPRTPLKQHRAMHPPIYPCRQTQKEYFKDT